MSENSNNSKQKKWSRRDLLVAGGGVAAGVIIGSNLHKNNSNSENKDRVQSLTPQGRTQQSSNLPLAKRYSDPLSDDLQELIQNKSTWDIIIIGSGYGGSIMAARLAEKYPNKNIAILERGKEYRHEATGNNKIFPESAEQMLSQFKSHINPLGLFELHPSKHMNVLVGSGIGGTSLINAGVFIEPSAKVFKQPEWPNELKDKNTLNPYFKKVRETIGVNPYKKSIKAGTEALRNKKFEQSVRNLASTKNSSNAKSSQPQFNELDLAITFDAKIPRGEFQENQFGGLQSGCVQCSGCYTGCNVGAKNTLDKNYLPLAKTNKVKIFSGVEVDSIIKNGSNNYEIKIIARETSSPLNPQRLSINTKNVVVSAGTMGTFKILKKSSINISPLFGKQFTSNGDYVNAAINVQEPTDILGWPTQGGSNVQKPNIGPVIISVADFRQDNPNTDSQNPLENEFIVVESGIPSGWQPALSPTLRPNQAGLQKSVAYFAIGHDNLSQMGELKLNNNNLVGSEIVTVEWPAVLKDEPAYISKMKDGMSELAEQMKGKLAAPNKIMKDYIQPMLSKVGAEPAQLPLTTVHPLGGCKMGNSISDGVVNHLGQVFDPNSLGGVHDGLYICDGSIIPRSLGCHPILTISALAEYMAEKCTIA